MLGSGELGKEVVIEFQRYGLEVIAVDSYENAPAMQVADRSYVASMLDGEKLAEIIRSEKPDFIIPEVEAIATDTLIELEKEGFNVIPTANATKLTMNREGIGRWQQKSWDFQLRLTALPEAKKSLRQPLKPLVFLVW